MITLPIIKLKGKRCGPVNKFLDAANKNKLSIAYLAIPEKEPYCNFGGCEDCYILHSESFDYKVKRSEQEIISDLETLIKKSNVIFSTTEVFLFKQWVKFLNITKADYILTNGIAIAKDPSLLDKLKETAVQDIILSGNSDKIGYTLPPNETTVKAISEIIKAKYTPVIRIPVTQRNLNHLKEEIEYYVKLGVSSFRLGRFIPTSNYKRSFEILEGENMKQFLLNVKKLKKSYHYDKKTEAGIYFHLSAILGTQYRDSKHQFSCVAGDKFLVIGPDNYIYPCVFAQQIENRLGKWENQKLELNRKFKVDGNPLDCKAFRFVRNKIPLFLKQ